MAIPASSSGQVTGRFTIPKNIKAGTKQVTFKGDGGSHAETTFTGQGTVVTNTMRKVENVMQSYYDPLAQTFMLDKAYQLSGVKIQVTKKTANSTPIIVQLRETSVGFPTRTIIAEGRIDPANYTVATSGSDWTTILFDDPFYASANIEYAVVVLCNDADTAIGISELGKKDLNQAKQPYVTNQPYQVGVLLSSANASTWTAHQDKDLTFQLLARHYTQKTKLVEMGDVTLPAGTSDILVSALTETPATDADVTLTLKFYDPNNPGTVVDERSVSDGQIIKLTDAITKDTIVGMSATLRATEWASATIMPGSQLIAGELVGTGDYVTRDIPANSLAASSLTVTVETLSTNKMEVFYAESKTGTAITAASWKPVPKKAAPNDLLLENGRIEQVFQIASIGVMKNMKLRVKLTGDASARPQVFNLRASVV